MDRYIRIYKESDFDFQYKLDSAHLSTPFKFIFFTTDINESSYECSFDGTTYYRCTRVDEDSIVFHIDGNTFECGNLRIRKEYFIDSSSFEDGICNSVDVEKTNVYIIEEGSNANSVVYCGSTLPNFDPMLIEQNVERAIIILNEKSDEVDQQLSYVILIKDEMEDLLSYATGWEDRLENIESTYATTSYVVDYVSTHSGSVDLSSYITYSYLDSKHYLDSIPSEYITQNELSANAYLTQHQDLSDYATKSYVVDYVSTHSGGVDLSSYVTKDELNSAGYISSIPSEYITENELNEAGYISSIPSEYITQTKLSANSYLTHHQSLDGYATESYVVNYVATYAPVPDLSSYVTKTELSNAGYITYIPDDYITQLELSSNSYATQSYVVDYVAEHGDGGSSVVIDEDIIPKENDTYTLGNNSYYYSYVYSYNIAGKSGEIKLNINYLDPIIFSYVKNGTLTDLAHFAYRNEWTLHPYVNGGLNLGIYNDLAIRQWGSTYTQRLYLNGNEVNNLFPTYSYINRTSPTYSYLSENYLPLSGGYMTGALIIPQSPTGLPNGAYSLTFKQNSNSMTNFHIGAESTGDLTISYSIVNDSNTPTRIMSLTRRSDGSIIITPYGAGMDKNISWGSYTSSKHRQFKDFYTYNMYLDGIDIHTLFPSYSYVNNQISSIEPVTYETTYENVSIWYGSYSDYSNLPDHTTYQLYLIQQ